MTERPRLSGLLASAILLASTLVATREISLAAAEPGSATPSPSDPAVDPVSPPVSPSGKPDATVVWPQFRGPGGQGHAVADLPLTWSEKEQIDWKTPLSGAGHSSPVVWGTQVWVTTATADGSALGALGVDCESGRIVHTITVFQPPQVDAIHADNTYASPTPVIAEGRLYVHYGRYGTACIDTVTGEVLWRNTELVIDHQGGPGSSPILVDDLLIVNCDGADHHYVAALDARTGRIRWRRERSAPLRPNPITHRAFATCLLIEHAGRRQVISPGADQLHAYDPATGEELWHVRYVGFSTVPCPAYGNGVVYCCTGFFDPELWAIRADGTGDVTRTHVLWKFKGPVPDTPSPLLLDGRIYTVSNQGVGTCLDAATGERRSSFRLGGGYSASPLAVSGRIMFFGENGVTKVVSPEDRPQVLAINRLAGSIKSSPAVSGNALYLRTDQALYRIAAPRAAH